ncbi:MAG: hypothetical protein OSB47_08775, partial [Pirellulaceae bacterium]|nr:hypothetical protein [Pirellulaceae bacterium]
LLLSQVIAGVRLSLAGPWIPAVKCGLGFPETGQEKSMGSCFHQERSAIIWKLRDAILGSHTSELVSSADELNLVEN